MYIGAVGVVYFELFRHNIVLSEWMMKPYISERVLDIACYVLEHKCTVREVAKVFCVSKSTAHKDLSERLPLIDKVKYNEIAEVLADNWDERYLRGGEATKKKYKG